MDTMENVTMTDGACHVGTTDRTAITRAILGIECHFPNDLSENYLRTLSLDKLQHIYTALIRCRKSAA